MFNTLGNIALDPATGLTIVDPETGTTLYLSGRAEILWEDGGFPSAQRVVRLTVELPSAWTTPPRCAGSSSARRATRRHADLHLGSDTGATLSRLVRVARTIVRTLRLNVALMRSLAAWCHDRRRTVIGLWVGAFILMAGLWATAAGDYVNNFNLPGTESQRAYDLLKDKFPQQAGDTASVVFAVKDGAVLDEQARADREGDRDDQEVARGARGRRPVRRGRARLARTAGSRSRRSCSRSPPATSTPRPSRRWPRTRSKLDGQGGVQVALGGDIIHWSTAEQGGAGEIFGILVAALVLFLTLGVVAMGLPLLNALFAMVVSLSLTAVIGTQVLDVVDWTPQLAAMIGIGVGIDYALLILNRFRLERGAGKDTREATLIAIDTSGRAVLFAGIVVVIAMLGMMLLGISFLYGPAIGAALSVLATMVAALTLMPAILGTRIGRRIKKAKATSADEETGFAARWSSFVARRPLPVAIIALAVLLALAAPALHMRLATSDASTYKKSDTSRVAYDLLKEGFGAGFNAPLLLAVELPSKGDTASLQKISDALGKQDGIAQVLPPQLNEAGDTATMIAYPTTTPQDETHRRDRQDGAQRDAPAGRAVRPARACRSAARRRATSTSPRRSATSCRCSSASSSASRCCCWRSCSARS